MAPNEFQSHLREAMTATAEKARANRVKLPENFQLGFDEFTTALPNTEVAPLLGQELAQVELLVDFLIDARVDALTAFKRMPLPEEKGAATPTPAPGAWPEGCGGGAGRAENARAGSCRFHICVVPVGGEKSFESDRELEPAILHRPLVACS